MISTKLCAALALTLAVASATGRARKFFPEPEMPSGWTSQISDAITSHSADGFDMVTVTLAVREQNMDKVREIALDVSDPDSPIYGRYLTTAQIDEITAPAAADLTAVRSWLQGARFAGTVEEARGGRLFVLRAPAAALGALLSTEFRRVSNAATGQTTLRAATFSLPAGPAAAVHAVFGTHGLPLPPRSPRTALTAPPAQPAAVTPTVIESTYNVAGVTVDRSGANRQAVAEFQGQTMNSTDLKTFFKNEVPKAQAGDDVVSKFVGDAGDKTAQTEASLDIQFIMGVSPGIKTEFWLYNSMDFCGDLKNWTSTILTTADAPLVHSVSYGWQGNLKNIGCKMDNVQVVDDDLAKLAAKGITIIFASGDSGSGYNPSHNRCEPTGYKTNTTLKGTVERTETANSIFECCWSAQMAEGFVYTGPNPSPPAVCGSGTAGTALTGTTKFKLSVPAANLCCSFSEQHGVGWNYATKTQHCTIFSKVTGSSKVAGTSSGTNAAAKQNCTIFSKVTGTTPEPGSTAGGSAINPKPSTPVLWPSWPASSPWVTAVGATRFVGQKVGGEEMATDQFGSGGGFSKGFAQSPNAKWQSADVAAYLKGAPQLPPAGSFPPLGRATPDVSALGEGFKVYQQGHALGVGGTSASAPTFAGLVSLLNEARLQAKKPAMGFLNPFLYKNGAAFFDVVKGTNAIGRGNGPLKYGFNCTKGWDPATGVGTPHFGKLLAAATGGAF